MPCVKTRAMQPGDFHEPCFGQGLRLQDLGTHAVHHDQSQYSGVDTLLDSVLSRLYKGAGLIDGSLGGGFLS